MRLELVPLWTLAAAVSFDQHEATVLMQTGLSRSRRVKREAPLALNVTGNDTAATGPKSNATKAAAEATVADSTAKAAATPEGDAKATAKSDTIEVSDATAANATESASKSDAAEVPEAAAAANASESAAKSEATVAGNATESAAKAASNATAEKPLLPTSSSTKASAANSTDTAIKSDNETALPKHDSQEQAMEDRQAAAEKSNAAVLGWTPDDNVKATADYSSSYDLQSSRGSVLLWTMAACYGALTVFAIVIFMICADRQRQLSEEKAFARPVM